MYGARIEEAPAAIRRVLGGDASPTWGPPKTSSERDIFFSIPTKLERESRILSLKVPVVPDHDGILEGRIDAPDLFVAWAEADEMRALDPTEPAERADAARHAVDVLGGFFEAKLPSQRCRVPGTGGELFLRQC